jgi:hypothetical protein
MQVDNSISMNVGQLYDQKADIFSFQDGQTEAGHHSDESIACSAEAHNAERVADKFPNPFRYRTRSVFKGQPKRRRGKGCRAWNPPHIQSRGASRGLPDRDSMH